MFKLSRGEQYVILVLLGMILLGSIIYFMRLKQVGSESSILTPESSQKETETLPLPEKKETDTTKVLFIHVAGAVKSPGVYKLKEGSRVFDAINAAGGYALNADLNALNLATPLTDGEKVYVPALGELPQSASSSLPGRVSSSTSKININTADAQQLESLPGIGPVFAQRIIDYRTSQGRFSNIEDIKNVSGIGEKRFEQLKDLITVN